MGKTVLKMPFEGKTCRKLANGQDIDYPEKKFSQGVIRSLLGLFSIIFYNFQTCLLVYTADLRGAFRAPLVLWLFLSYIYICPEHKYIKNVFRHQLSHLMGKPTICMGENKDADQLRGNRETDQRLCFRYSDSTIPLNPKFQASSSFCACTGRFVSDLFGNHIVGFPTRWLNLYC